MVNYAHAVHGQNVTSDGTVRQWRRMFKDGQVNKCSRRAKWSAGHLFLVLSMTKEFANEDV
jgi:hypothetical protein